MRFPAGQEEKNPPAPPRVEPYKTHLAYVKERRSDSDGAAILAEALDRLRRGPEIMPRGSVPALPPATGRVNGRGGEPYATPAGAAARTRPFGPPGQNTPPGRARRVADHAGDRVDHGRRGPRDRPGPQTRRSSRRRGGTRRVLQAAPVLDQADFLPRTFREHAVAPTSATPVRSPRPRRPPPPRHIRRPPARPAPGTGRRCAGPHRGIRDAAPGQPAGLVRGDPHGSR